MISAAILVLTRRVAFAVMVLGAGFSLSQEPRPFATGNVDVGSLPESIEFNRDVRPILSDHCFYCHGPDPNHRQAELRLDDREASLQHEAFVPGKGGESLVIHRIESTDLDTVMPPPSANKPLSPRQKMILRRWIDQGAQYQKHWAYAPVQPPTIVRPDNASDTMNSDSNTIDVLVRRKWKTEGLDKAGLVPSPIADRRTLIRRLYSDLIGLPPTPEDVEAFIHDESPNAYSALVERLLGDERYGERMAMHWLDVVRFADTIGYHSDNPRNIWPYRDYVIRSFNSNKPFDRFTIEQLAGDLIAEADQELGNQEALVGSAFNRLLLTTEEGGAQPKDYESRMLADRVRAVGSVWLGQTTGCAQCHDHKFDPFTMRDFYSLGAFFADIQEGIIAPREEGMAVMTDSQRERLQELDSAVLTAKQRVQSIAPELDAAQKVWEKEISESGFVLPELAPDAKSADAKLTEAQVKAAKGVVAALKSEKRSPQQSQEIQKYFRDRPASPYREERSALEAAEKARADFYRSLPKCIVTKSAKVKRIVRILPRGNWLDESGEAVKPALPSYLPQLEIKDRELNRLDLARWLVSKDNPLTARVTMNRLWKQFFGVGLSKVLDDLGAQGELPVNPELLDFLAFEFMDKGWDVKHMVRLMVMSQTYRQVSTATPELMQADPYNRQLARQTPFRIDAELVRDYALAVSGLLVPRIGGPSAKPYQPDGYWENLNFPMRTYVHDEGDSQYRRGLYTWWQRTFLHPSMVAFDAPSREECCAERNRSNIPQQALVLLNDPTYVEAARALAVRALRESLIPGADSESDRNDLASDSNRLDWMVRQVLQRSPREEETTKLVSLLRYHRTRYEQEPLAAKALLAVGLSSSPSDLDPNEVASWTHIARVLLSLHETITRN